MMQSKSKPAEWAIDKAIELSGMNHHLWDAGHYSANTMDRTYVFARYIEEHEDEPVDPLLVEAREVIRQNAVKFNWDGYFYQALTRKNGEGLILAALRRGITLTEANHDQQD